MSDAVHLGIIGCGGIAKRHIDWSLARPECRFVALCDTNREAAEQKRALIKQTRADQDPAVLTDYRELLARVDVDGVLVLLPHSLHHPVSKAALEAGKHVLVEKPMTTTAAEARDLLDTSRRTGKLLGIGYQRSYMSEYLYVRRMVLNGDIGRVRFMTGHVEQAWYAGVLKGKGGKTWRSDPKQAGGGQLVDTGSHTCAALLYVSDMDPVEVFAFIDNCGLEVDVDTSMAVRFAQGAQATLTVGGFGYSCTESIRVVGDKSSARIFFRTVKEQALEVDGQVIDAKAAIPASNPNASFIDAILGKGAIGADARLGLRVAQLSEAAYESARKGLPVKVAV